VKTNPAQGLRILLRVLACVTGSLASAQEASPGLLLLPPEFTVYSQSVGGVEAVPEITARHSVSRG
jgi:hypothetical protein